MVQTTAIERTYANLVYNGRRTIDEVPEKYRENVRAYLLEHYGMEV